MCWLRFATFAILFVFLAPFVYLFTFVCASEFVCYHLQDLTLPQTIFFAVFSLSFTYSRILDEFVPHLNQIIAAKINYKKRENKTVIFHPLCQFCPFFSFTNVIVWPKYNLHIHPNTKKKEVMKQKPNQSYRAPKNELPIFWQLHRPRNV